MNTQPAKRSSQLSPLSEEHKDGLLFVSRLRENLEKTSLSRLKNYILWFWKNHIRAHFYQEEKILFPYFPIAHPMATRLKEEHEDIRDLVLALDHDPDKKIISALCHLLELHIRFEELEFFSYLESNLKKEELDNILKELEAHPVRSDEWEDAFWES